jgi:lipoprotein-anchoring transpeptidase ErfK/SrfK
MRRFHLLAAVTAVLAASVAFPALANATTLRPGQCGPAVFALQERLVKRTYLPPGYHPGCYDYRTTQAVMAFEGWVGFTRDGIAGPLVLLRLPMSITPIPWGRGGRHVEIHKAKQILFLVGSNGKVIRVLHVSTAGPGHITPSGHWSVYSKSPMSWSHEFHVWLPWASYVVGGDAMHSYPDVPGYPASHGCIRVPAPEAQWLYYSTPIGTPVWISN